MRRCRGSGESKARLNPVESMTQPCSVGIAFRRLGLIGFFLSVAGCKNDVPIPDEPTYSEHIQPVFEKFCVECHGIEATENSFDIRTWRTILAGGDSGPAVEPGQPEESLLLDQMEDEIMPPEGDMPTAREIELVADGLQPVRRSRTGLTNRWEVERIRVMIEIPESGLTRRDFSQRTVKAFLAFSLIDHLCNSGLLARDLKPTAVQWLNEINQIGFDLKGQKLDELVWQQKAENLLTNRIELTELLKFIDFDQVEKNAKFVDNGARSIRFKYPKIEGVPEKLAFGQQIFALKKDRSVVPHGHNNMATAFLVLKGNFHGRHYDRIEDQEKHMIIKRRSIRNSVPERLRAFQISKTTSTGSSRG